MENERLYRPVEAARQAKFGFGADLSKKEGFIRKNALIGHRSISLQSVCVKITLSQTIAVERLLRRNCTHLPSLCFKFLAYFSLVAGLLPIFVTSHTYRIFYLSVTMSPP